MTKSRDSRLGAFRHRDFALYWAGGFLSNTGTWLQNVAGSVLMYLLTGSPLMVGLLNFATFLPLLLFSLLGGVVSDRFPRRQVVIVTHAFSMAVTAGLTVITLLDLVTPAALIVSAFVVSTSYAFAKPSLVALLPALVPREEIVQATATNTLQFMGGQLVGPLIAAAALALGAVPLAFGINSLTFLGPIVAMLLIRPRGTRPPASSGSSAALMEGLRYVRRPAIVALLASVVVVSSLPEAIRTLSPVFGVTLANDESAAGLIVAAPSVGSALALLFLGRAQRRIPAWRLAAAGFCLQGLGVAAFALAPGLSVGLVGAGLVGAGFGLSFALVTGRLQELTPDEMRGRVMAVHTIAHLGVRPFTAISAGLLATGLGARTGMLAFVLLVPLGLWALAGAATGRGLRSVAASARSRSAGTMPSMPGEP